MTKEGLMFIHRLNEKEFFEQKYSNLVSLVAIGIRKTIPAISLKITFIVQTLFFFYLENSEEESRARKLAGNLEVQCRQHKHRTLF